MRVLLGMIKSESLDMLSLDPILVAPISFLFRLFLSQLMFLMIKMEQIVINLPANAINNSLVLILQNICYQLFI